jgi:hypothetical protein
MDGQGPKRGAHRPQSITHISEVDGLSFIHTRPPPLHRDTHVPFTCLCIYLWLHCYCIAIVAPHTSIGGPRLGVRGAEKIDPWGFLSTEESKKIDSTRGM